MLDAVKAVASFKLKPLQALKNLLEVWIKRVILTPMQIFLMKVMNLSNDATMVLMKRRNMISTISIKMMERMYSCMSTPGQMVNVLKNPSRIQNTLRHTKLNKEVCMSAISFFEFRNALDRNQEIEFSLFDRQYFATPRTDPPEEQLYAILDVEKNIWIFEGSIENMMSFKFDNDRTLGNNFSSFIIEYIL